MRRVRPQLRRACAAELKNILLSPAPPQLDLKTTIRLGENIYSKSNLA